MYRLATCFWVSICTAPPQGLSGAPNYQLFIKKDLECSGMVKHFHDILISANNATSCCEALFDKLKSSNKAPFAINLLFMEEFEQLKTPAYIEEGLDWLDQLLNSNK